MAENTSTSTEALSGPEQRALAVLVDGGSVEEAAAAAGKSPRQVRRYRNKPAFAAALNSATTSTLREMFADLSRVSDKGIARLEQIIDDPKSTITQKMRATEIALRHCDKLFERVLFADDIRELKAMLAQALGSDYPEYAEYVEGDLIDE